MIERLKSNKIPAAVGAYSSASRVGNLIFTSGQLPINPDTGKIDKPECIEWQVNQSMTNLKNLLEDNGTSLNKAIKITVFLDKISDFAKFNEVYRNYFTKNYPARSAFEVGKLPMGALVEIEAIVEA